MTAETRTVAKLQCLNPKCRNAWWPRSNERPSQCPKCHSATWDKPRKPAPARANRTGERLSGN